MQKSGFAVCKIKKKILSLLFVLAGIFTALNAAEFYWEEPAAITKTDSRFPVAVTNGKNSYVFWEEINAADKTIYLNCRSYETLETYYDTEHFAGPFTYSGQEVPELFSAAILDDGRVAVAVLSGVAEISVFSSSDGARTFQQKKIAVSSLMIAPRLFATKSGFKMFTSVGETDSFTIFSADSSDGYNWSKFSQFAPSAGFRNPFVPALAVKSASEDVVVFQSQYVLPETNRLSYQLYMTIGKKEGRGRESWSKPVLITDENSLSGRARKEFTSYQNQMASLYNYKGDVYLTWERTESVNPVIWTAKLDENGMEKGSAQALATGGNASRGRFFEFQDNLYIEWFDTRRGTESVYFAKKTGELWEEQSLVENKNSNTFPYPLVLKGENSGVKAAEVSGENPIADSVKNVLAFVFQQTTPDQKNTISLLYPDKSVLPPTLIPLSFKASKRSRENSVKIQINFPKDSSNIAGYSYTWNKDEPVLPREEVEHFTREKNINVRAVEDGKYYLSVRVRDYAGNWSEPAVISYHLDLTPPDAPEILDSNLDKYGFVDSNTFAMNWKKSPSEDAAGYVYRIDYLGKVPKNLEVSKNHPLKVSEPQAENSVLELKERYSSLAEKKRRMPSKIQSYSLHSQKFYNLSNGVYAFSVAAVDEVGNIGEPSVKILVLNKYQPSTFVSSVEQKLSDSGEILLSIYGGGFTYDGTVSKIIISSGTKPPYVLELNKADKKFKVQNDRYISDVNLGSELDEGYYRIGLYHTDRGLYFTDKILKIEENGTLKIESEYRRKPRFTASFQNPKFNFVVNTFLFVLVVIFTLGIFVLLFLGCLYFAYRKKIEAGEVRSLVYGGAMPLSKIAISLHNKPTLRRKLIGFTFSLIVLVVLFVTFQNGRKVIKLQEQTMASALENRAQVLLESLCSGVKNFFPANNILELSALPGQKDAMSEVEYVTIIGQPMNSTSSEKLNYIWATNDADILEKTDSYSLIYGESQLKDPKLLEIIKEIAANDKKYAEDFKELSDKIDSVSEEAAGYYAAGDEESTQKAEDLSSVAADLRNELDSRLSKCAMELTGTYPYFDNMNLDSDNTEYYFYKPVLYRKGNSGNYIHGLVYLKLSTQTLVDSIRLETIKIITSAIVLAVIAVIIGIFGASLLSAVIVSPIRKLESHVLMIGQTKNKLNLKGKDVKIKSRDEVGRLGDAVNNMTRELVAVAEEEELAMDGKAVQKAFLPLESAGGNNKKTIAELNEKDVQCYGYYEGESGVSGDYFDYKRLDEQWFVIIKCDVSGHGIPAAIIMTVVATLFRRYFEKWTFQKKGTRLNELVEQINDFIEGLGLRGKFATLILSLLNLKTGELYMCNAGDNLVHIYDSKAREFKVITLASAPTAGVFTSDIVAMKGGFKVEKTILNRGDTLFLYTDGIEESTRRIRNPDYSVIQNTVEVKKMNPKTHQEETEYKTEDAKEEFGPERIKQIVEAVFNHRKYVLTKDRNPAASEILEFDFSKCEGTINDAIMALAAIEKVYRLYRPGSVSDIDYIKIDKKIDEFLSKYFNMYEYYSAKKSGIEEESNYLDYDSMLEDEQSDDLTLLAVRRL